MRCFYICIQILVVALSAIFSYVYWFDIIFSVGLHSCHSIDHRPTYQAFFFKKDVIWVCGTSVCVSELRQRVDNKILTGNTSFFFVNILNFSVVFFFLFCFDGFLRILITWWENVPLIYIHNLIFFYIFFCPTLSQQCCCSYALF